MIIGDIVLQIIENQFSKKYEMIKSEMPKYMPLKLLILGYDFSGRKSISQLLKSKYDILVIQTDELVVELVELVS